MVSAQEALERLGEGNCQYTLDLCRRDARLIVVLGHSQCEAVLATLGEFRLPMKRRWLGPRSIVERIRPSVEGLLETELKHDFETLKRRAVRANIGASVIRLRHGSALVEQLIENEGLLVVGAEYSVETGVVEFFDGAEADGQPKYSSQAM